nr:DNA polymerase/3'-5' exonuclease PolX [Saprospiraceae bacterium]
MTNRIIAGHFRELADLMELMEENPFKIRSYRNAYQKLRNYEGEVLSLSQEELEGIPGIGKAISAKIIELKESGTFAALERMRDLVPEGVAEMLKVKGLGPGRIGKLWRGLQIQSPGELLYACEENRLLELKGFGKKSQEDIRNKVQYYLNQRGMFFYSELEEPANRLVAFLQKKFPAVTTEFTGDLRRNVNTLSEIELLTTIGKDDLSSLNNEEMKIQKTGENQIHFLFEDQFPLTLYSILENDWAAEQLLRTGPKAFLNDYLKGPEKYRIQSLDSEKNIFAELNKPFVLPEHRDWIEPDKATGIEKDELVTEEKILGVVHAHSTYSDGAHSLKKMAEATEERGFEYLVITDHSAYASYAGGLSEARVREQWREIDLLNQKLAPFRIMKGIEADILPNGNMDYNAELLNEFEVVIASVHSVLNMDEKRATGRLIRAIENPHTHLLGHPTGRLLLSRPGYPLNVEKITDACAANGMAIELNANPHRLDLDWSWIWNAQEKGIKFSINPDAHSIDGIGDIKHGVRAARKGGMYADSCLNTLGANDFLKAI